MTPQEIKFLKLQNEINVKFEDLMVQQESNFNKLNLGLLGITSAAISKRLTQLFVVGKFRIFNQLISERKPIQDDLGFSQIKIIEFIRNYIKFFGYLIKFHLMGTFFLFSKKKNFGKKTTICDIHGFDNLFKEEVTKPENFFKHGPINYLNNSSHLLITSLKPVNLPGYSFIKNPWLELMKSDQLSIANWPEFTAGFFKVFFSYTFALLKNPLLSKLFRDIGFIPLINFLNSKNLIANYTFTNTLADEQNLAISSLSKRKFVTHFVSYSANSKPMKYKCIGEDKFAEYPYFRNIIVDNAWLWNQDQADWLKNFNPAITTHVVGPILFYLPNLLTSKSFNNKNIILFDVTPFPEAQIKERMGWQGYNFYQTENAVKIVEDVIEVFQGYKIQMKPKRPYSAQHDQQYVGLINNLVTAKKLDLLDTTSNIYQAINEADLVITTPYSSPALIAPSLGKKAIYYDPTGLILCNYQLPTDVFFCSGKAELKQLAERLLGTF